MTHDPQVIPMRKRRQPERGEPWNVSAQDVADFLGVDVNTVYRMPLQELLFTRVGRQRRYRWSDVHEYVERNMEEAG